MASLQPSHTEPVMSKRVKSGPPDTPGVPRVHSPVRSTAVNTEESAQHEVEETIHIAALGPPLPPGSLVKGTRALYTSPLPQGLSP